MLQYIASFFRPELLFNFRPSPMEGLGLTISLIIFGAILIFGIALSLISRSRKNDKIFLKGLRQYKTASYTMGIIGYCYAFFAYEGALFIGARLWFLLIVLIFLFWIFFPTKYFIIQLPKMREEIKRRKEFEKYLP